MNSGQHYSLRPASPEDWSLWSRFDHHLSQSGFEKKVQEKMAWILYIEDIPAGVLRWGLFWDLIPFLNLLHLGEAYRKQGLGRWAMHCWEEEMTRQGYAQVMVSTQVNEEGQHFYRKLGYRDIGAITMDFSGPGEPLEMFLAKNLRKESNTQ